MKIKIRTYEQLLVSLLALMSLINYVLQRLSLKPVYNAGFRQYLKVHPSVHFDYAAHLLWPRVGVLAAVLFVYFWVNLFAIPQFLKVKPKSLSAYLLIIPQVLILAYLLAFSVNAASWYAHPAWNNYGEFSMFASFGYNENPLTDLWAGFDRALLFLGFYLCYACVREYAIYRVEKAGPKTQYRILVTNQIAASWCIFILLPVLFSSFNIIADEAFYHIYFVFIPSVIIIYLSNTYRLFPRFANNIRSVEFAWRLAASTLLGSFPIMGIFPGIGMGLGLWSVNWLIQLLITTPITWMLFQQRKDRIIALKGVEIALSKSTADLQFLRSQINPHFLFNALNTLYGTALIDGSKRTANGIQMLGDMMRFMLDDNHLDFIPLANEISYLRNYITLQKLRFPETADIVIEEKITVDDGLHRIIPMLLIPFVENAFKHGIDITQKSWIKIVLGCTGNLLDFEVRNSVYAVTENDPEKKQAGIGLKNVEMRLQLVYPKKHQFVYGLKGNEFVARLNVQL